MKKTMLFLLFFIGCYGNLFSQVYTITGFGAKGDGQTLNTTSIQKAIDECAANGGGEVVIPNGQFLTGSIFLKSNVYLRLDAGAILKGSADSNDYRIESNVKTSKALIGAYRQDNIGVYGQGEIYGQGEHENFKSPDPRDGLRNRPYTISFYQSTNIKLKDFRLQNGACWNIRLKECDRATIDDITVISRVVANNDGLDITDCHDIRVSNCLFDCGDDCICPKSESKRGVKNLVITNCIVKSESNAIKFGTGGMGGFENVTISNCVLHDTRLSGIAIEMVDGGTINRVTISNIVMHNVNGGVFIKLGKRSGAAPGIVKNINISDIVADGIGSWLPDTTASYFKPAANARIGMSICGQPGYNVENISLNNVYFQFAGGGTQKDAQQQMQDRPETYPEYTNFGVTPAYGLNVRHVKNIRLNNVQLDFIQDDQRPALFMEDVQDITINALKAGITGNAAAFIRSKDVTGLFVYNCNPQKANIPFILFEGKAEEVTIMNNDFTRIKTPFVAQQDKNIKAYNNLK